MKRRYIAIVCAIVTIVILYAGYVSVKNATVRLDKIPLIGWLFLGVDKPAGFDATVCEGIITWEQIDNPPPAFDAENNGWFYLNPYTKRLLKNYMKENNLGIVPENYPDFHLSADFEECMETFRFVELKED